MSGANTRVVHLEGGQERQEADNTRTRVADEERSATPASFRALFVRNYDRIARKVTSFAQPGLAVVAVDMFSSRMVGSLCIAAKVGAANSAIIGRHSMADLYLDGDASLSLRHLAVIVSPLSDQAREVRFRLIDLRTRAAFRDEHGRCYGSLVAEGAIFVRCGSYALFFLITGEGDWPAGAEDGWACIPERVYLEEDEAEPDRWLRKRRAKTAPPVAKPAAHPSITHVQTARGPIRARADLLTDGEEALGLVRISSDAGMQSVVIGARAAQRGVLLGRYERCDVDGSQVLVDENISRVHLLIILVEGRLHALDTASTNGTWLADREREIRIAALDVDAELTLGDHLASLRWCPS